MKQKNFFRMATLLIISVLVGWLGLGAAEGKSEATWNGTSVEDIYNSIRDGRAIYEGHENNLTFQNEGIKLACTLTVPKTQKKCPIVITLAGFLGARNEEPIPGTNDTVFGRQCQVLAEYGIASLRVDYRGYGESEGEFNRDCNFSTQISDVQAVLDFICRDLKDQVNCKSIGILGFSQGGIVGSVVAGRDKRVDSLVLWSAPAYAPHDYEGLLTREGIQAGLALPDGGDGMFGLYLQGQCICNIQLGKRFFEDLFSINPLTELRDYDKPMMYIAGKQDFLVWPQPIIGETYIKYHKGHEKLVVVDADHEFNYQDGPNTEKLDDVIYWSTAWFIKTLKNQ